MYRQIYAVCLKCLFSLVLVLSIGLPALGQTSSAAVSGTVQDTTDARIPNASVKLINTDTGAESNSTTSKDGNFTIPGVLPGRYRLQIERDGFDTTQLTGITLNVGDNKNVIIRMKVGSPQQTVTVDGSGSTINTTDASVSTVIDRNFVENLPLNGRTLQSLITLTPGVELTNASADGGQFSVNGQRATANYLTIDGVGANIAPPNFVNQTPNESLQGFSSSGTTSNLVSIDALQEFRIETSTYAPEFGRTPGGQISLVTRAGTDEFHGDIFEFFRNEVLDANDWFANQAGAARAALRLNDFGGVIGGPLIIPGLGGGWANKTASKTFFFFSFEGFRLLQPKFATSEVPSSAVRMSAPAAIGSLFDAFPVPNGPMLSSVTAQFASGYSDPSNLTATSLRVDHVFGSALTLFGRYNHAPSDSTARNFNAADPQTTDLAEEDSNRFATDTLTVGANSTFGEHKFNEFRFNYSRNVQQLAATVDSFGGAEPAANELLFPNGGTAASGYGIEPRGTLNRARCASRGLYEGRG